MTQFRVVLPLDFPTAAASGWVVAAPDLAAVLDFKATTLTAPASSARALRGAFLSITKSWAPTCASWRWMLS